MANIYYPEMDQALTEFHDNIFKYDPDNLLQGNINSDELKTMNIFRLIFGDDFVDPTVTHTFAYYTRANIYPPNISARANMSALGEVRYKSNNPSALNAFDFNQMDLDLLDQFRKYRQIDPTFTLASIDFLQLTDTGKNIYNILFYLDNGVFYFDPNTMVKTGILDHITKLYALQLKLDHEKDQSVTFKLKDEQINPPEPGPNPVGPPPYP